MTPAASGFARRMATLEAQPEPPVRLTIVDW